MPSAPGGSGSNPGGPPPPAETLASPDLTELQVILEGACYPERFLALLRDFTVFDDDGSGKPVKKMAGYHQFHAVRAAVGETLRAAELQRERGVASGPDLWQV